MATAEDEDDIVAAASMTIPFPTSDRRPLLLASVLYLLLCIPSAVGVARGVHAYRGTVQPIPCKIELRSIIIGLRERERRFGTRRLADSAQDARSQEAGPRGVTGKATPHDRRHSWMKFARCMWYVMIRQKRAAQAGDTLLDGHGVCK